MSKNLAAVVPSKGARLAIQERPIPTPGPNQIVIRNHSIAVNPADHKMQDIGFFIKSYPTVLGSDIAGTVHSVGKDVTFFKKGDRVTGYGAVLTFQDPDQGAFQTYTLVYENAAAKIPSWLDYPQASVITMAFTTAAVGLTIDLGLPQLREKKDLKGTSILVWGGSSSVGAYAIQIAKQLGLTIYATASPSNSDYVKSLGAEYTFDHRSPNAASEIAAKISEVSGSLDYLYDAVSSGTQEAANEVIEKVGKNTKVVTVNPWKDTPRSANIGSVANTFGSKFLTTDNGELGYYWFHEWLPKALEAKTIKAVPEVQIIDGGLESAQKAFDTLKNGVSAKKVVIEI